MRRSNKKNKKKKNVKNNIIQQTNTNQEDRLITSAEKPDEKIAEPQLRQEILLLQKTLKNFTYSFTGEFLIIFLCCIMSSVKDAYFSEKYGNDNN